MVDEQAIYVLGLLMQHWNIIVSELLRTLQEPHVYLPVLLRDERDVLRGNDWAQGFLRGVQMRPESWRELLDSEEHGGPMVVIMLLAHEHNRAPEMRPPPIPADKCEDLLIDLTAGLVRVYRYFEPYRRASTRSRPLEPCRREGAKVGRNESCPCGSGRKYKHCCASSTRAVH